MNVCIILQCKYTTLYRFWYNFVLQYVYAYDSY